ncbi:MAG TPA: DUF2905 family protein [Candidatus Dormibacteraeota bacterium]
MREGTGFLGRKLMLVGALIALAGLVMVVGRLPGDIPGSRGGVTFYCPLGTSLLLSVVLTLVLNLLVRR